MYEASRKHNLSVWKLLCLPWFGDWLAVSLTVMVEWVSMFETEVQVALVTCHSDHFLLLTAALGAFICKDLWGEKQSGQYTFFLSSCAETCFSLFVRIDYLSFPLSRVRFAVSVYVFPNFDVWHFPSSNGNGGVAQWAYRNLDILLKETNMYQPQPVCFKHW